MTKYYLRLKVEDKKGVLAKITNIMSENNISIDSFLQKPKAKEESDVTLFFTTHTSFEKDIQNVIEILNIQSYLKQKVAMIRIEE